MQDIYADVLTKGFENLVDGVDINFPGLDVLSGEGLLLVKYNNIELQLIKIT